MNFAEAFANTVLLYVAFIVLGLSWAVARLIFRVACRLCGWLFEE